MAIRYLIVFLFVIFSVSLSAREQVELSDRELEKCQDPSKLRGLCSSVSGMIEDSDPESFYVYDYQRKVYEASCVDYENDTEEEISRKVNQLWKKHGNIRCTTPQFSISDGHVLKFAVSKRFSRFVEEAAQVWKVDLNRVDKSDNRTLLDYVAWEIERSRGGPSESLMMQYHKILRKAGAKYREEL